MALPSVAGSPSVVAAPRRTWRWCLLVAAVSVVPVAGVFTLSRIFFVRDLTLAFHSRFLWLRASVWSGQWPWWDPFPASGQSAAGDALYQLFLPPTLALRLLLPEVLAWNLWVALPVPLAGTGCWLFLRRHVRDPAAVLGALAFSLSGPIVSTTNFPNLSWSIAAVPYVFWAIDRLAVRPSARDAAVLAVTIAMQALAGEPVSLAGTLALAAAYTLTVAAPRWRSQARALVTTFVAVVLGLGLASIQFAPLLEASRHSVRSMMTGDAFWSFHPLALLELLVPHFYGDYFNSNLRELAWMVALNSGREPFYYTMYVGVGAILVAALAATVGRRRHIFWSVALMASIVAALGSYTPAYPALQQVIPGLSAFRFPVKYLSLASFALAALTAHGWQSLLDGEIRRRRAFIAVGMAFAVAACAYVLVAWLLIAPARPVHLFFRLAEIANVRFPIQGAEYLIYRARPLLTTLFLKLMAMGLLVAIAVSTRREHRMARAVLAVAMVVDLAIANGSVNPTMDAAALGPPSWISVMDAHPQDRIYMGGRLEGWINPLDPDAPKWVAPPEGISPTDARYLAVNELMYSPSGWHVRESISFDLPLLWPLDYARLVSRFRPSAREERLRLLERIGTRYCVLPTPPHQGAVPLASLNGIPQMKVYECHPSARRVSVVPDALIGPDVPWQIEGLFQERFDPSRGVLVSDRPPDPVGIEGPAAPASATIITDGNSRVVVRAGLPGDGYLALFDSYSSDWRVDVDGRAAPLMRANGLFRAVHLTRGPHVVTFTYHPRALYLGAAMSALTGLALAAWCVADRRRRVA